MIEINCNSNCSTGGRAETARRSQGSGRAAVVDFGGARGDNSFKIMIFSL
jgi:hypothetical protein